MTPTDSQLAQDLFDIASAIPAAKRSSVAPQLTRLQALVGSTTDLFVDRRKTSWAPGGKARSKVELRTQSPKVKKPSCRVTWRGGGSVLCTTEAAAELVKKTPSTLAVYLSKGQGRYNCVVNDEVITVDRL